MVEDNFGDNALRLDFLFLFVFVFGGRGCDFEEDFDDLDWSSAVDNGTDFTDLELDLDGLLWDPLESLLVFFDSLVVDGETDRTLRFLPCPSICNPSMLEST